MLLLVAGVYFLPRWKRTPAIEERIEQQRATSTDALGSYAPKGTGSIDDPSAAAVEILRQLPGVANVEVLVAAAQPASKRGMDSPTNPDARNLDCPEPKPVLLKMSLDAVYHRVALLPRQRSRKKLNHPRIGVQSGKRYVIVR